MSSSDPDIHSGIFTARLRRLQPELERRVLIVDDDELERELFADRLGQSGLAVTRAGDGRQALEILEREMYGIVVVDWQMPEMDGIEMTEQLRARGKDDIYIIMLTARGSRFDYDRGYLAGVDDYLTKNLPDTELMARIHTGFNMVSLRRQLKLAQARIAELESRDL